MLGLIRPSSPSTVLGCLGRLTLPLFPLQDWTDYDEKAQESVGIYEVAHQFVKC